MKFKQVEDAREEVMAAGEQLQKVEQYIGDLKKQSGELTIPLRQGGQPVASPGWPFPGGRGAERRPAAAVRRGAGPPHHQRGAPRGAASRPSVRPAKPAPPSNSGIAGTHASPADPVPIDAKQCVPGRPPAAQPIVPGAASSSSPATADLEAAFEFPFPELIRKYLFATVSRN